MRVTLNMTGPELALLYIAYGNQDARNILMDAIFEQKQFDKKQKELAAHPASTSGLGAG